MTSNNVDIELNYRVLAAGRGIAIDIAGSIEENFSTEHNIEFSQRNLISDQREQILQPDEREQILHGLESLISDSVLTNRHININIKKVEFNPCHFDLDGLYWASREWLAKALEIEIKKPIVSFDKVNSRFVFIIQ